MVFTVATKYAEWKEAMSSNIDKVVTSLILKP